MTVAGLGCSDDDDGDTAGDSGAAMSTTGDEGTTGAPAIPNEAPTFEARVDAAGACGASASALEIRATRFACVNPPPAPCTLPNPPRTDVGERIACPSDEVDAPLRLAASAPGRFYVEVVTIAGDGSETAECHSDGPDPAVIVLDSAFNTNPTIAVDGLGSACPEP